MELNIIEKFILLAHHPVKRRFRIPSNNLKYGIMGAILLELFLRKNIIIQNARIHVNEKSDFKSIDYPILKQIIQEIAQSRKPHKPRYWIRKFGLRSRKIKWEFLMGLEKKRLVRIEHKSFIWIPYRICYLIDKKNRDAILFKLRELALYKKEKSEENIAMMGLIDSCKMYRIISADRFKRKLIRKEIKSILKDSTISQSLLAIIKQIHVAISMANAAAHAGSM